MTRNRPGRRTPLSSRVLRTAAGAALGLGLLAGCGGVHPGVAAEVGGQEISDAEIDRLSRDLCTAFKAVSDIPPQGIPRSVTAQSAVAGFVLRAVADGMREEYGVAPGPAYEDGVRDTKLALAQLDPEVTEHILDTWVAGPYLRETLIAVGAQQLSKAGVSESTLDERLEKGIELAQVWTTENEIVLDPRFPEFSFDDESFGNFVDGSGATVVAVSDFAKQTDSDQPAESYVASLPESQRCV